VTTAYLAGGLWEEDSGGATRILYSFGGKVIAQRDSSSGGSVSYLHGDHLGSTSLLTNQTGGLISQQEFDPWGKVRTSVSGSISQTSINYTGQRLDGTGLLYYHSRYYDPGLGKFVSPDTIVPGMASGKGGDGQSLGYNNKEELRGLTVDFHEPNFLKDLAEENAFTVTNGFWFQLSDKAQEEADWQWGPLNPQALNRYAYALNNPLQYIDPTGHFVVVLLAAAFAAAGIVITTEVIVAIAAALTLTLIIACLLDGSCRNSVANLVSAGIGNLGNFINSLGEIAVNYSAATKVPDLTGKSRKEAHAILEGLGFKHKSTSEGGYETWMHDDDSKITIKPDGRVSRATPRITKPDGSKYRKRVDSDGRVQDREEDHDTGEDLKPDK